jgi:hypothetical protein
MFGNRNRPPAYHGMITFAQYRLLYADTMEEISRGLSAPVLSASPHAAEWLMREYFPRNREDKTLCSPIGINLRNCLPRSIKSDGANHVQIVDAA